MKHKPRIRTLRGFLRALGETPRDWETNGMGMIRLLSRNAVDCPITAVTWQRTGCRFTTSDVERAASEIGLSVRLANNIVGAADDPDEHPTLRAQLLKACGLEEAK